MTPADEPLRGYAYRLAPARPDAGVSAEVVEQIVRRLLDEPRWAFRAASLWDAEEGAGRANLRPIAPVPAGEAPDLRGDFGHVFSARAELRWRRREDGQYEALLLTEGPLDDGEGGLQQIGRIYYAVEVPPEANELLELDARGPRRSLRRVEYRDPDSLAVRFVRFCGPGDDPAEVTA